MESGWNVSRSRMKNSSFFFLMHFVLDVFVDLGQFAFEVQVDVEVKIPERSEKENMRIKATTLARKIKSFSHLRER